MLVYIKGLLSVKGYSMVLLFDFEGDPEQNLRVILTKTDLVMYSWKRQRPIVEPTSPGGIVISCADRATYFGD